MAYYKIYTLALLLTCLPAAMAAPAENNTKQWFNALDYADIQNGNISITSFSSKYYFAPQGYAGVWDEFGFLDTDSKVGFQYTDDDFDRTYSAATEVFVSENWFVDVGTADLSNLNSDYLLGAGYLYDEKLKLSFYHQQSDESITGLMAEYNHMLNDIDYIGVALESQNGDEVWSVSSRYFRQTALHHYFTLDIGYTKTALQGSTDEVIDVLANYYFGTRFAIGLGSTDSDTVVQTKLFASKDFYMVGQYTDADGGDITQITLVAQF